MNSLAGSHYSGLRAGVLMVAAAAMATAATISGTVLDAYTRQPVPYAEVYAPGLGARAWCNELGAFTLVIDRDTGRLAVEVNRVGYVARRFPAVRVGRHTTLFLLPGPIRLDGVTVSAQRAPVPVGRSGPVTVLTGSDLELRGRSSIAELLAQSPATVSRDYGNMTTIGLRGASVEQTVIALDGVKLNTAQDNLVDVSTLPLGLADRVEVARSGASAFYGANAVGGIVNIMTADPDRLSARLSGGTGSYGRRRLTVAHTNWMAPLGYLVGVNLSRTGPTFPYRDSADSVRQRVNSDLSSTEVLAKGVYRSGRHRASLLGEYGAGRRGAPGPISFADDSARTDDSRAIAQFNYGLQESDQARLEATLYHHRFWRNYRSPTYAVNDTHYTTVSGAQARQRVFAGRWLAAQAGVELEREVFVSTAIGTPTRLTRSGWLEAGFAWQRLTVTPAVRFDWLYETRLQPDSTRFRANQRVLSPKVTATYNVLDWVGLYAGVGRSFRAPTFNELYWPEDQWTAGNPHLRPEWSTSIDLGARGNRPRFLDYRLGLFASRSTDLIQWQVDSTGRYRPANIDTASITGVEAELGLKTTHASVTGNVTWMAPVAHDRDLVYRPRLTFTVNHRLRLGLLGVGWDVCYAGRRYANAENTDSLPGGTTFNIDASVWPRFGRVKPTLRAGIRDLFDRQYRTIRDYPVVGRSWYAELGLEL